MLVARQVLLAVFDCQGFRSFVIILRNIPFHVSTGGNVINVIGGDDNSKEDGEEDQDFISRWAMGYVSSQFSEGISQSINRVHLFNCDNTYNLEPVEHLLNKIAELDGHHMCVVKHSFKLAKMSEIVDKISTLMMDMAVFVVHAHESWPSSNEDNRGIGFTKIYRALLQATGKKKKHFHSVDFPLLKFAGVYVIISTVFFRSFPKERDKRNVMQNFGHYLPTKLLQAID